MTPGVDGFKNRRNDMSRKSLEGVIDCGTHFEYLGQVGTSTRPCEISYFSRSFQTSNDLLYRTPCDNIFFVYQAQKVHLFRPSLGFLAEAQPRTD
jgi:hypothetical protein